MPQDPLTNEEKEKLRSINHLRQQGTVKRVSKDNRGSYEDHHWDGRVDANINPSHIHVKATTQEPEVE